MLYQVVVLSYRRILKTNSNKNVNDVDDEKITTTIPYSKLKPDSKA